MPTVRFPFGLSCATTSVCLLGDFLRIIRRTAVKPAAFPGLGSHVLFRGTAKHLVGRLLGKPRRMQTLREERGDPEARALQAGEGVPRSTIHPGVVRSPVTIPSSGGSDDDDGLRARLSSGRREGGAPSARKSERMLAAWRRRKADELEGNPRWSRQEPTRGPRRCFYFVWPLEPARRFPSPPPLGPGAPATRWREMGEAGKGLWSGARGLCPALRSPTPDIRGAESTPARGRWESKAPAHGAKRPRKQSKPQGSRKRSLLVLALTLARNPRKTELKDTNLQP